MHAYCAFFLIQSHDVEGRADTNLPHFEHDLIGSCMFYDRCTGQPLKYLPTAH